MAMQLDLFEKEPTQLDVMRDMLHDMKDSQDKVRRALFAENREISKFCVRLMDRMDAMERQIILVAQNK